jgi:hypothetical protein
MRDHPSAYRRSRSVEHSYSVSLYNSIYFRSQCACLTITIAGFEILLRQGMIVIKNNNVHTIGFNEAVTNKSSSKLIYENMRHRVYL